MRQSPRQRILANLRRQRSIEGDSEDLRLLEAVAALAGTASDWRALASVEECRYGTLSYECHHFYRPTPLLLSLRDLFTGAAHSRTG